MILRRQLGPPLLSWAPPFRCVVYRSHWLINHMGMDQYLYIPFLGDEHPFTSYFDVHQGYKVLTHCHIVLGVMFTKLSYRTGAHLVNVLKVAGTRWDPDGVSNKCRRKSGQSTGRLSDRMVNESWFIWSPTEFWKWKKGSTWASKQLRRAGAVFFHNSVLLIKMHTSKIGNTLYTEPFWKGRDVLQLNFHIYFSMWGCFLAYDHFHNYLFPERGDNFSIDMFP